MEISNLHLCVHACVRPACAVYLDVLAQVFRERLLNPSLECVAGLFVALSYNFV